MVGYPFGSAVSELHKPSGCFWDPNGHSFFNRNLTAKVDWDGIGAICKRKPGEHEASLYSRVEALEVLDQLRRGDGGHRKQNRTTSAAAAGAVAEEEEEDEQQGEQNPLLLVMLNGQNAGVLVPLLPPGCLGTVASRAGAMLGIPQRDQALPKRLYATLGRPVRRAEELLLARALLEEKKPGKSSCGLAVMHLLLDQEQWVWPGRALGQRWKVAGSEMQTLSLAPKAIFVRNFLTAAECDLLIESGQGKMYPSPELHADPNSPFKDYRTSTTGQLGGLPIGERVRKRSALLARLPLENVEDTQLLRYEPGQWYKRHTDYFDHRKWSLPEGKAPPPGGKLVEPNRMVTIIPFLNDVEEGGETVFPLSKAPRMNASSSAAPVVRRGMPDCSMGLTVRPEKGAAVLFYNKHPDMAPDPAAAHGGCPPVRGVKWAANSWLWNVPFRQGMRQWGI